MMQGLMTSDPNIALQPGACALHVAEIGCVADPSGVLYLPADGTLVVADLHLEKGSAFATRGMFLPPYDTAATLMRLAQVVAKYQPSTIVALGDSFHDCRAGERITAADCDRLAALQVNRTWIWIAGNHDPAPPPGLGGQAMAEFNIGPLVLRHEPRAGAAYGEIAGHLHPVARVTGRGASLRRRCFVSDGLRCILPAFGAYAGGLNIRDHAYSGLFGPMLEVHVLGQARLYKVKPQSCSTDS